jgi:hypothetical protein
MSHHQDHEAEHTPAAIRRRLEARPSQDYLKDSIYGAIDGAVPPSRLFPRWLERAFPVAS